MSSWLKFGAILLLAFFSGCGYTLNHRLRGPFESVKAIYVPVFSNGSDEPGAEIVFTNALIREMESHGDLVAKQKTEGALILRGSLDGITTTVESQTPKDYRGLAKDYGRIPDLIGVRIAMTLVLQDPNSKVPLWSKTFEGYRRVNAPLNRTYNREATSSLGMITQSVINNSYEDIARDVMRDVYDNMVDLF